jgi:hypothetical protein
VSREEDIVRVGVVGGLDRVEGSYEEVAATAGHEVVFHDGHIHGRGRDALAHLVDTCDVVLILTDVNSHGAVQLARKRLRARGRSPVLVRKCGLTRFAQWVSSLEAPRSA